MNSEWEILQLEHDHRIAKTLQDHAVKQDPRRLPSRHRLPHLLQAILRIIA